MHKHVTLGALLQALGRKEKGFLYLETHAGRGTYALGRSPGIERVLASERAQPEIAAYARSIADWRAQTGNPHAYPGSPLAAVQQLRAQDRAVLIEQVPEEAAALRKALPESSRIQVIVDDGFERLRAFLPPPERRGLTFVDPPYEETQQDFARVETAVGEALRRFEPGLIAVWYPIKDARDTHGWHVRLRGRLAPQLLIAELWLHPCDSRVALNGSGMLVVNPPYRTEERMREWLPALHALLDPERAGGTSVRVL